METTVERKNEAALGVVVDRLTARVAELRDQAETMEQAAIAAQQELVEAKAAFAAGSIDFAAFAEVNGRDASAAGRHQTIREALATVTAELAKASQLFAAERNARIVRENEAAAAPLRKQAAECVDRFAADLVSALEAPALRERARLASRIEKECPQAEPVPPLGEMELVAAVHRALAKVYPEMADRPENEPNLASWLLRDVISGPPALRARFVARLRSELCVGR